MTRYKREKLLRQKGYEIKPYNLITDKEFIATKSFNNKDTSKEGSSVIEISDIYEEDNTWIVTITGRVGSYPNKNDRRMEMYNAPTSAKFLNLLDKMAEEFIK